MSTRKEIYLDYASTTPLDPRVLRVMMPYLKNEFGNPGAIHTRGVRAKKAVDGARKNVATFLRAHPDEIIFTSGGTESNNLAIRGTVSKIKNQKSKLKKIHAITSVIEHSSVLEVFRALEREGLNVTYLPVDGEGIVDLKTLKKALRPETALVSIMYANNEIGTIQPIREIGKILRHFRTHNSKFVIHNSAVKNRFPIFHCDASQAALYLPLRVDRLGVDLLTLDGQKIYGPKGVGALFVRRGIELEPLFYGGGQERGMRGGTENVPAIVGLARAIEITGSEREMESVRLTKLREFFLNGIQQLFPHVVVNGYLANRLSHNINISIPDIDTEFLSLQLDAAGIEVSTKSTCMRDEEESYVVAALGGEAWRARHSLRITLGRFTTKKDIDYSLRVLRTVAMRH